MREQLNLIDAKHLRPRRDAGASLPPARTTGSVVHGQLATDSKASLFRAFVFRVFVIPPSLAQQNHERAKIQKHENQRWQAALLLLRLIGLGFGLRHFHRYLT
jgi:hypothetical protein